MELNFTTFILEIINFLVLVWILKRLFYLPIKKSIDARKQEIEKSLADAKATNDSAAKLRTQYETRIEEWQKEREEKLNELRKELDGERAKRLKNIETEIAKERELRHAQEKSAEEEHRKSVEEKAIQQSLSFLSKLLSSFSLKETESAIIHALVKKLNENTKAENLEQGSLQDSHQNLLKGPPGRPILIQSAFELDQKDREALLKEIDASQAQFKIDPSLRAGVEISVGSTVLRANLRDELKFFSGDQVYGG